MKDGDDDRKRDIQEQEIRDEEKENRDGEEDVAQHSVLQTHKENL